MKELASGNAVFNGDISEWQVQKVGDFQQAFYNARKFNVDISKWSPTVARGRGFFYMFNGATLFNADVSKWKFGAITNLESTFKESAFNRDISSWDVKLVTAFKYTFQNSPDFTFKAQLDTAWETSNTAIDPATSANYYPGNLMYGGTCYTNAALCKKCDDIDGSGNPFLQANCDTGYAIKSTLTGVSCGESTCASTQCCDAKSCAPTQVANSDKSGNGAVAGSVGGSGVTVACATGYQVGGASQTATCNP